MKERVYRFRAVERSIAESLPGARVLDVGCGRGDNLRRFVRYGSRPTGIDPSVPRLREARDAACAVAAEGEFLPWADGAFDLVYISHVLHHARDVDAVLHESFRVLAPGGLLFLIETVDDSPLMRLARAIQPRWDDDDVLNRFRFRGLVEAVEAAGFAVRTGTTFNWMYFLWELLPLAIRPLDVFSPIFIGVESLLARPLRRFGGHCWLVAQKPGSSPFPARDWGALP